MSEAALRELVQLLAHLRRTGVQQSGLDACLVPRDNDAAYAVAAQVAGDLGWPVGGWKIAAIKEEMQRALRTTAPIYGRVYNRCIHESPATLDHRVLLHPVAEVEFAATLGADLPPRATSYRQEEVADAVASLRPGMEIAECRFVNDKAFPPLPAILADGSGSGSIILGPPIADWRRRDIAGQEITLRINGVERRRGTARMALDHPLVPLTWLANELSRTGVGLKAGQVVSTGTITGMVAAKAGEAHVADYGPLGEVRVRFSG
ncbi:2-keto-4-pentenoate hydratase [Reyranella sp. CPCC 100927]|uniref:2-keto-4-pentenoate hydratase n=1 Tax=Reyranella sp. CPCC 100927 TaxID=2599616 RepID=UPI0011B4AE6F|nr:fumarylacetoacetate hydrolase family protein [Reyranella sp. CPCC 100927]TWT13718.1 hydratase [Reyranella sp. CPCC 100927]